LVIVLLGAFPARADVTLSKMFSDHAVLQRDLPVPVWGTAEPGEQVTVQLGDAKATTAADAQGKWSVRLPPVKLNAVGQELTAAGKNAVTVKDVLVGDVWLCGGQSNMELALKECAAKEDIAAADFPAIRCLMTTNKPSRRKPPADVVGAWAVCTPANAPAFTGTGFYFARRVHRETGVPIGLVDVGFGGTQIEASIAPEGFELEPWLKQQPSYAGSLAQPDHIALEAFRAASQCLVPRSPGCPADGRARRRGWHRPGHHPHGTVEKPPHCQHRHGRGPRYRGRHSPGEQVRRGRTPGAVGAP